jgi:RHS repeat-associated protein
VVAVLNRDRAANTHKQDFVYGQRIDEIVMLEQADVLDHDDDQDTSELTRSFYHRNALGSVLEITDMLEATAVSYRYDPYGAVTITVGGEPEAVDPLGQHWTFTGRFFDEETGFYYYRARMYDPAMGRFLQRDPLGYGPGASLFQYASSNPCTAADPLGLEDTVSADEEERRKELGEMFGALEKHGDNVPLFGELLFVWIGYRALEDAKSSAVGMGPTPHEDDGSVDALRHCLWQCRLAKVWGATAAKAVGDIHEKYGRTRAVREAQRKGDPDVLANASAAEWMDQANNAIGRECANSGVDCLTCCLDKLRAGQLMFRLSGVMGHHALPECERKPWEPPFKGPRFGRLRRLPGYGRRR